MPLWLAVVLLLLSLLGIALSRRYLRKPVQSVCVVLCVLLAVACAAYIRAEPTTGIIKGYLRPWRRDGERMKSIKVIVIGFIFAVALVAWPAGYMQYITAGIGFLLAAVLMAWLGVRRRKSAQKEYEDDVRRYTGTTMMKVVWIEESADERWAHQKDGSDRLRRETYYLPTYEYTVNGTTYRYSSRQSLSGKRDLGRQVMGYYDPAKPERITENRPRKPVLGGFLFFFGALILLFFGIMTFTGNITIS